MTTFIEGTRVRVNENYLKAIGELSDVSALEAVGTEGTVLGVSADFVQVELDKNQFHEDYDLFYPHELELV
jgi:hypothetical protein